jgi:hypothetical protein
MSKNLTIEECCLGLNAVKRLTSTYRWMISRCYDPQDPGYPYYGGRGIKVCDRWLGESGLIAFILDMGVKPAGLTLDRKDTNSDYSPDNCSWQPNSTQQRNRRNNTVVWYEDRPQLLIDLCERKNLDYAEVKTRLRRGWDAVRAIETPGIGDYQQYRDRLAARREYTNRMTRQSRKRKREEASRARSSASIELPNAQRQNK